MDSIFQYTDPAQFLRKAWEEKKRKNPNLSLRAWAKSMNLKSHASLHAMLSGQRDVPAKYVPLFVERLGLTAKEGLYLETLIQFKRAKKPGEKKFYLNRLNKLTPKGSLQMKQYEHFQLMGNPIHSMILEMTNLRTFRSDAKWIQSMLRISVSMAEIRDSIQRLLELGLLKVEEGIFRQTHRHLTNLPDIANIGSQQYHHAVSVLAAEQVFEQPVDQREFNSYCLNIRKDQLPKARRLMREFVQKFIQEIEASPGEGEATYQFNLHFFALTKGIDHEKSQSEY